MTFKTSFVYAFMFLHKGLMMTYNRGRNLLARNKYSQKELCVVENIVIHLKLHNIYR